LLFALALAFYLATLAPTVLWGDDAFYQRSAVAGILPADGGGHWLWLQMARQFVRLPVGDAAYRVNLLSAAAASAALAVLYLAIRCAGISRPGASIAALALAVSHTFWTHAVRAEVYTLFTFWMAVQLTLWFRWHRRRDWPIHLAAFLFGATLLSHQMAALLAPAMLHLVWRRRAWQSGRAWAATVGLLAAGLVPFLLVVHEQVHADSLADSVRLYLTHSGRDFGHAMFDFEVSRLGRDAATWLGFLALQFVGPALLLGVVGARRALPPVARARAGSPATDLISGASRDSWTDSPERRDVWGTVAVLYVTAALFAAGYRVNDQFAFFLPSYVAFAFFIGAGWDVASTKIPAARLPMVACTAMIAVATIPPLAYRGAAEVFVRMDLNPLAIRDLPGREPNRYFLWPSKRGYGGAEAYGRATLESLPPGAVLIADHTPFETLMYLQAVAGMRPDVRIVKVEAGDKLAPVMRAFEGRAPVFLADDDPRYYNLEP